MYTFEYVYIRHYSRSKANYGHNLKFDRLQPVTNDHATSVPVTTQLVYASGAETDLCGTKYIHQTIDRRQQLAGLMTYRDHECSP